MQCRMKQSENHIRYGEHVCNIFQTHETYGESGLFHGWKVCVIHCWNIFLVHVRPSGDQGVRSSFVGGKTDIENNVN